MIASTQIIFAFIDLIVDLIDLFAFIDFIGFHILSRKETVKK